MSEGPQEQELIDIAVLDDDRDFLNYIEDLLSDEGQYAVRVFERAEALFEAAEARRPDIVLLDMKMGRTRGDEVLEELLRRWPELCVIIVTGYPSLEDMRATFKKNVFDYLAKPFTLGQLRQVLANAAERYGLGRALTGRLREKLGQRIRVLRAERGWSLKDLAAATRLSVSQISSIERGANLPSMESLLAIARAFGMKPSQMLASIDF
ncbi:MAG: response regulator [Bryobacteraceae bacterium]|jgi:DNA-binding NtrC family response regulator